MSRKLARQFNLGLGQHWHGIEQFLHSFGLAYGRFCYDFKDDSLYHLRPKWYAQQVTGADPPIHFRWQVIIKLPTDSGDIYSNAHK